MKYTKRPKRKYGAYWKETAGFDCKKELQIYRFLCGSRMLHKPEVKYCFTRKEDWGKYVYDQYVGRSVEQLQNFLIYLEQKKRNAKDTQPIILNYLLPLLSALIVGYFIPGFLEWEKGLQDIEIIVRGPVLILGSMLFILCLFWMIYHGTKQVWDNSDPKYFYKDYMKIIAKIIRNKTEIN